jgi:enoyl-[acyl-carrier-protein] reductase (NADH)
MTTATSSKAPGSTNPSTLCGKVGQIPDIANAHCIAGGCADASRQAGAELAITSSNEQSHVWALAEQPGSPRAGLIRRTAGESPAEHADHHLPDITEMGRLAALLASDVSSALTANIAQADAGHHIVV